jgi:hypothetical protein
LARVERQHEFVDHLQRRARLVSYIDVGRSKELDPNILWPRTSRYFEHIASRIRAASRYLEELNELVRVHEDQVARRRDLGFAKARREHLEP